LVTTGGSPVVDDEVDPVPAPTAGNAPAELVNLIVAK
jgi:hypothetical protein